MTKKSTAVVVGLVLAGTARAGPVFVNGLAIPGGTGDTFGTSLATLA